MAFFTAETVEASARRRGVPEHLIDGLTLYITHGIQPGHFLMAVLSNDLMNAMARADEASRAGLFALCTFLYNEAPRACYGTEGRVDEWIRAHRQVDTRRAGAE